MYKEEYVPPVFEALQWASHGRAELIRLVKRNGAYRANRRKRRDAKPKGLRRL